ncbi:MAG: DUF4097 family beta strand repeat protein [Saprospiraceae bacterium]|nr:DUF4097 family beta strand repeat protein [Saprospiraceae bacterium]
MKNYILITILCFCAISFTTAQDYYETTLNNTYKLPSSKRASLNLKFASDIKVSIGNSNELQLKAYIKATNEEIAKMHVTKAEEGSELLQINTDYNFPKDDNRKRNQCWSCDNKSWDGRECLCLEVRYEVIVPKDVSLDLETISCDIKVNDLTKSMSLKTISGDVETQLNDLTGDIYLKSISGAVDIAMKPSAKADLSFKSVTGEIYTDFDNIKLDGKSTSYSKKLNSSLNGGGPKVTLETVSGDIFFRKSK